MVGPRARILHLTVSSAAKSRTAACAALVLYLVVSIFVFALPFFREPATSHFGFMYDPAMMMWCMAWWPYTLGQHINPFVTHAVWAPSGFNLTWSASVPALGASKSVGTRHGRLGSDCLLQPCRAAGARAFRVGRLPGSCWEYHRQLRCRPGRRDALRLFALREVGHVLAGHLNLTSVFVPPLCVLLGLMWVKGRAAPLSFASALALLLVIQCLISTEVLATMTLFGGSALPR